MKPKYLGQQNSASKNLSLDKISRKKSRKDLSKFVSFGVDIWNAYEFSYLFNGKPKIIVLEISIPSNSLYTIESKSMKLFLNSFYNKNFASSKEVLEILRKKISSKCKSNVKIISKSSFKSFDKSDFINKSGFLVYQGFRSICPVTSQPDWGNIYLYSATDVLNKKEIFNFLFSFRNHGGFHEQCIELIFKTLKNDLSINHLEVCGRFQRRGGIDINPIRGTHNKKLFVNFREFNQ